ncbi:MAG: type II toxin-antitoxin system HicA family toxin [Defluviitaleaceae bacterium]|nr:type II toxin-antitoxin system HicA family toxin [Defluviitaleaceae bacterium]
MKNKVYNAVTSGQSDNNIRYADLKNLILSLGFIFKGQKGSHAGYYHPDVHARISIQPTKDGKAKPYQVKQLRDIINHNGL